MHHAEPNVSGDRIITLQELREVFHQMAESRFREVLTVLSEDPLGRFLSERAGELRADENRSVSVVRAGENRAASSSTRADENRAASLVRTGENRAVSPASPASPARAEAGGEEQGALADGSRIRTLPSVPLSALITDRRTALLSLRPPPGEAAGPILLVTRPGHVSTLLAVFDHLWSTASAAPSPGGASPGGPGGRSRCRAVLELLAEGLTDNAVAARLGIAERTVRREVNGLMQSAGATSRFQLALRAQELGWLRRPAGETTPDTGPEGGPVSGRLPLSRDRG
ncbi:helix-turn-helix transcriptional regulator [Streptosporangium sp. NPDC002524]|uniref:helix-turn-helix transcriptional regulator n=1 Tax=Streptosporangium sp. NPDC002524 TaxID=3154537 RepID=UPI0033300A09